MKKRSLFLGIVCFLAVVIVQLLVGNVPYRFFAFPLNVLLAAVCMIVCRYLYNSYRDCRLVRFMMSGRATTLSLGAFMAGCLVIGLFPQLSPHEAAAREGLVARLGCYDFMTSWIFVAILFFLLTHLGLITVRGVLRRKERRWRFGMTHAGLWLALFAGFCGSSDTQNLRLPVYREEPNRVAYAEDGRTVYLDYELRLLDFHADYYENGMPRQYEAVVDVGGEQAVLHVNHPFAKGCGEDIYLTGYDTTRQEVAYCVLQIVRQPWKYVQLAGICLMMAGAVALFIGGPKRKVYDKLG